MSASSDFPQLITLPPGMKFYPLYDECPCCGVDLQKLYNTGHPSEAMPNKSFETSDCWKKVSAVTQDRHNPSILVGFRRLNGRKVIINALLIAGCFFFPHNNLKAFEIVPADLRVVGFTGGTGPFQLVDSDFQRITDSVELLAPVSSLGKPVTKEGSQYERNDSPGERDEPGVSVEQQYKLTPDDTHKFWQLLLVQLAALAVAFPVAAYLSVRASISRDWHKNTPERRIPKVLVIAMFSILCIPRGLKPYRLKVWEQRYWFLDMKVSSGIEAAYRDTWCWKFSFEKRWYL